MYFSRRQLDDDEHIVGHEPADCGDFDGEEVGGRNGFPMGGEKRAPRRPVTSLRRGLDAMFSQNIGDGAPGYGMAEIREGAANACIPVIRKKRRPRVDGQTAMRATSGVVAPLLAEREIYLWWWPR